MIARLLTLAALSAAATAQPLDAPDAIAAPEVPTVLLQNAASDHPTEPQPPRPREHEPQHAQLEQAVEPEQEAELRQAPDQEAKPQQAPQQEAEPQQADLPLLPLAPTSAAAPSVEAELPPVQPPAPLQPAAEPDPESESPTIIEEQTTTTTTTTTTTPTTTTTTTTTTPTTTTTTTQPVAEEVMGAAVEVPPAQGIASAEGLTAEAALQKEEEAGAAAAIEARAESEVIGGAETEAGAGASELVAATEAEPDAAPLAAPDVGGGGELAGQSAEEVSAAPLPKVERLVTDDELAVAAANVRKSWTLLDRRSIEALVREAEATSSAVVGTPMKIAMLASVIAEIVSTLPAVRGLEKPLVYIRGQSVAQTTTTTAAPRPAASVLSLPLTLPLTLASRAGQSLLGQSARAPVRSAPPPAARVSPFASLWPSGATVPKPTTTPPSAWSLYQSLLPRKLSEASPSAARERFGNFLHDELPREIKRKIWEDFVADSRQAKSAEEQNALLRRLERGQDAVRTRAPPRRLGQPIETPTLLTIADKIAYAATQMRQILQTDQPPTVPMIEAARLFLATLEHTSQTQLMDTLVQASGKDDTDFVQFQKTHQVDSDLQIGLLLLNRIQNVLSKA